MSESAPSSAVRNNTFLLCTLCVLATLGPPRLAAARNPSPDASPAPSADTLSLQAKKHLEMGLWREAERKLRQALKQAPDHAASRFLLGSVYVETERYAPGIRMLEPFLVTHQHDPVLLNNLAWAYAMSLDEQVRSLPKAIDCARKSVKVKPDFFAAWDTLAETYTLALSDAKGMQVFNENPLDVVGKRRLIEIFLRKARNREALQLLTELAEKTPDDALVLNNLAWVHATAKLPEVRAPRRAIRYAQDALLRHPTELRIWHTLGIAYYVAGDYVRALDIAKQGARAARLNREGNLLREFQDLLRTAMLQEQNSSLFE
jgi:tetratricopeptide (TPR) repeat protein